MMAVGGNPKSKPLIAGKAMMAIAAAAPIPAPLHFGRDGRVGWTFGSVASTGSKGNSIGWISPSPHCPTSPGPTCAPGPGESVGSSNKESATRGLPSSSPPVRQIPPLRPNRRPRAGPDLPLSISHSSRNSSAILRSIHFRNPFRIRCKVLYNAFGVVSWLAATCCKLLASR